MSDEQFEIVVIPQRRLFPKPFADYNDFGIFGVDVVDSENWDLVELNPYGNITIKGGMPDLQIGKTYTAMVCRKKDPKFGLGYEVVNGQIYMKMFTTREEQLTFLSSILSEFQTSALTAAYPHENLVDLIKNDKLDLSLVKGIGEATLAKIKDKILANEKYQRAIITLTGEYGIPYGSVKKLSDKYGSPDMLIDKINENPYILTELDGFGFKKVDEMALKMGVAKDSKHRIVSCAEYVLSEESGNGHCWMKLTRLINESIKLLELSISSIKDALITEAKTRKYVIDEEENIIYLREYHKYELQIKENVFRLLNAKFEHEVENLDEIIAHVEEKQGFPFTDEQKKAIVYAIEHNILIVNGKAGTGKTSVIKGIVEVLRTIKGLEYATCALSGKASQRIQESTGLDAYTIHRLYGYNPQMGWIYDEYNHLEKDIIILDEASMVNSELFYYVMRAIKDGAKLIITGDTAQLEPIGVGNVLVDLLESNKVPKVELTIVHRQAQKSGILSCANLVREGKKFVTNKDFGYQRLGELQDLYLYSYEDGDKVFNQVMGIAKKFGTGNILDFQIIVPMKTRGKNCAKSINEACQKLFNQDPENVDPIYKIEKKNVTFIEGDKIILNGNNYDKGVFNGTIGIIKYINSAYINKDGEATGEIVIDFEGVGDIRFTKSEMNRVDLAYAITVHKSQGSQWKYVVFAMDYSSYVLLNRQLTYTAMTRASKALFMPVELKALQFSIETNKSTKRQTFLPEMLKSA
ncbi:ATP-dependent RecD-like DNA helicase [Paenibacillus alvei]|uniref:AAA family ATPase n=1 Tax=Paenibacillus alvei TaxID=44250 RepID=UPI00227DE2BF|nr:AAA family ATPase [Paenibacillus alvei]MCY9758351.1 ATP-dependent RecD-like DNA helicase [Paenibacillus alvei]